MKEPKVLNVSDDVKWIGVFDQDIVTFDIVMETKYGTTYNSYFIDADKKAVVETTKKKFWDTWLEKVKSVTNPAEIEYIICNHTEPDHSGNLQNLLELAPDATVVGSGQALKYLDEIVGRPFKSMKVKDGDTLDLGNKTLKFIGAPNLHWPDTMYTYLEEDKLLFTCDSFGAHWCSENMFDDDPSEEFDEAFNYYFDVILKPFSKFMLKAIDKIKPLEIDTICTGHGLMLRYNKEKYIKRSEEKAREYLKEMESSKNRVFIAYISAYGYTYEMAIKIREGLLSENPALQVEMVDIEHSLPGDLESFLVRNDAVIIGSPTINQNTLLPVYKLFSVVNPIRDKGKAAAVFGSYGWSGEAVKLIEDHMKNLKFNVMLDGLAHKFYPNNDKSTSFLEFGRNFARELAVE